MITTNEFWHGEFGNEYTDRNRVDWLARVPFWTEILAKTGARNILEVGCNVGWNLLAIRTVNPHLGTAFNLTGIEINQQSKQQAENLAFQVYAKFPHYYPIATPKYNLVFTAGLLIHISPEKLEEILQSIIDASSKYVLSIEYFSEQEEEVLYRGHKEKLWKRNYGQLYQDMGLQLIETGDAVGFNDCKYWLLKK